MKYDEDYFERGIESGQSLYTNYRWLPDLTIPMAYEIIRIMRLGDGDTVLEFGCAKGYLVKALRLLYIDAYGCDVSEYAIGEADKDVKPYVGTYIPNIEAKAVIAKDVFEHLTVSELDITLEQLRTVSDEIFVIVPVGYEGKYMVPAYELDTTHVIREGLMWWRDKLWQHGYKNVEAHYCWGHLKESWIKDYPTGNGFLKASVR